MPTSALLISIFLTALSPVLEAQPGLQAPRAPAGIEVAQMARMMRLAQQRERACAKIRMRIQEAMTKKSSPARRAARLADLDRQKQEKRCDF